jgi:hypothetical protein
MSTRRISPQMLYPQSAPARWVQSLAALMNEAAADLCRAYWQHGRRPALQPARIQRPGAARR